MSQYTVKIIFENDENVQRIIIRTENNHYVPIIILVFTLQSPDTLKSWQILK